MACTNPQVIEQHDAKVYGKEPPGTPPMTVPHLDTRYIDGQRTLLFGPFANVGPKFLKNGSNLDLFKSVKTYNITTLLAAAVKNLPLIKYSFDQVIMTKEGCMNHLRISIQKHVMKIGNYTLLVNVYKLSKIHLNTVKDSSTRYRSG